jgi:hypothetical protein
VWGGGGVGAPRVNASAKRATRRPKDNAAVAALQRRAQRDMTLFNIPIALMR